MGVYVTACVWIEWRELLMTWHLGHRHFPTFVPLVQILGCFAWQVTIADDWSSMRRVFSGSKPMREQEYDLLLTGWEAEALHL